MADQVPDPYEILGVGRGDSADAIRSVYRKLAQKNHPDTNPGDKNAEERFKRIAAAYDILSDPKKRRLYDEFGTMGLREGFDAEQARAFRRHGGSAPGFGSDPGGAAGHVNLGDLFADFFAGASAGGVRGRGADVAATVEISLGQSMAGSEVTLQVQGEGSCAACGGQGQQRGASRTCPDCQGRGQVQTARKTGSATARCPHCHGTGKRAPACRDCHGSGRQSQVQEVTVRIPKGVDHGSRLRVPGRGQAGPRGTGDLILETRIRPHPYFRREGLDLHLRLPVTVAEALQGTTVEVPDGQGSVKLRIPPGSQQGSLLRLKGRGVARGTQRGHLFVEIVVRMPEAAHAGSPEAMAAAAEAVAALYKESVRQGLAL